MDYRDKHGAAVSVGDILLYNEGSGYAYGIHEVVSVNGELCGVIRVADDWYRGWRLVDNDEPTKLRYYTNYEGGPLSHAEKIGSLPQDAHILTLKYAQTQWPGSPNDQHRQAAEKVKL